MSYLLYPNLFKPLKIKDMILKNRIMSAPNMLFHTVDGRPTQYYIGYLEHKARGGAGLVTLGEIAVCDGGSHTPAMEWTRDNLPLLAEMSAVIHEHGAAACVELTHGGMRARPEFNTVPIKGPVAGVSEQGYPVEAMDKEDMDSIASAFADAAEYWYGAGFDAVLVHAAHGWLFSQFLSPLTNTRSDEYGGSLENRMRFPLLILKRIRERVGPERVVMIRLSGSERHPQGFTVDDMITFLERAQEYVDLAEISAEGMTNFFATTFIPLAQNLDLAAAIKKSARIKIPVFTVGSILYPEQAEEIIASGKADGVSMSRALIADPYLPKKAGAGRSDEITPCLRCLHCTDSDNKNRHFVCSVNPLIGREARLGFADNIGRANFRKKVLIIGGGPAGMQAAVTAGLRGHEVILCEQTGELGGLLKFADYDSLKHDLRRFKEYLIRRVESLNIKVMLNTKAGKETVGKFRPDCIIVAAGSAPIVPRSIKGIDNAYHAAEVYTRSGILRGERVVMIGGGLVGIEVGLHLANLGKKVTVLEKLADYARDAMFVYRGGLEVKIKELGLEIITGARCLEVTAGGVRYEKGGREEFAAGDVVLYAVGMQSNEEVYWDLYDQAPYVAAVGDCKKTGNIAGAIHSGYFAALDIGML